MYIAPSEIAKAIHECPLSMDRAYEEDDWLGFCVADDLRDLGWKDGEAPPDPEATWVLSLLSPGGQREVLITSGPGPRITIEVFRRSQ